MLDCHWSRRCAGDLIFGWKRFGQRFIFIFERGVIFCRVCAIISTATCICMHTRYIIIRWISDDARMYKIIKGYPILYTRVENRSFLLKIHLLSIRTVIYVTNPGKNQQIQKQQEKKEKKREQVLVYTFWEGNSRRNERIYLIHCTRDHEVISEFLYRDIRLLSILIDSSASLHLYLTQVNNSRLIIVSV